MSRLFSKTKVFVSIALVLCLLAIMLPTGIVSAAESSWADNCGTATLTETDGVYLINSAEQLALLAKSINDSTLTTAGKQFRLTADIDLAAHSWVPIGTNSNRFKGTFDGANYTISGLNCIQTTDYAGLFGYADAATIRNVTVRDAVVEGKGYVGGIAGRANSGCEFDNCGFDGSVEATASAAGGLVGYAYGNGGVTLKNCWTTGFLTGSDKNVGGLVGVALSYTTTITPVKCYNCYSTMSVTRTGNAYTVGGLLGADNANCEIKNCYFAGTVSSGSPIVGAGTAGTISTDLSTSVYYKSDSCNGTHGLEANVDAGALSKTSAELATQAFVDLLNTGVAGLTTIDGLKQWMLWDGYPIFERETPKLTSLTVSSGTLNFNAAITEYDVDVAYTVNSVTVRPTANTGATIMIDGAVATSKIVTLSAQGATATVTIVASLNGFTTDTYTVTITRAYGPWDESVATAFDGGDGLTAATAFEIANGAQLAYLSKIANEDTANTSGKYFVLTADIDLNGGAWTPIGYHISNSAGTCSFRGTFDGAGHTISGLSCSASADSGNGTGGIGLFGAVSGATVKNLTVKGTIESQTNGYTGGIVGRAHGALTLTNCAFDGTIKVASSENTAAYNGGLLGYAYTSGGVTIEKCWTAGSLITMKNNMGGLVGYSYTGTPITCSNSYSVMTLRRVSNADTEADNVSNTGGPGGLIGSCDANVTFNNCHFAGYVNNGCPISPDTDINTTNNLINVYYKADSYNTTQDLSGATTATSKTAVEFANGHVADLLNSGTDSQWVTNTTKGYPVVDADLAQALSVEGNSIRTTGKQGIRFKFGIKQTAGANTYGILIANAAKYQAGGNKLLCDSTYAANAPVKVSGGAPTLVGTGSGKNLFAAALYNFTTKAKYETAYVARAYATFTVNGDTFLAYSDVKADNNSVYAVAVAAYADKGSYNSDDLTYIEQVLTDCGYSVA